MKEKIVLVGICLIIFLLGMASMRMWDNHHRRTTAPEVAILEQSETLEVPELDLENATEPEGVVEVGEPGKLQMATESQLTPIHMPEIQTVISRSGKTYDAQEQEAPTSKTVSLGDAQYNTSPAAEKGGTQDEGPSSIVMIAAPVKPLVIKTLDEYKDFKRRARGSYPTANFATEQVLVLESDSNLPDKVFEIQKVEEKDGNLVVLYRVNVFGLDKKTNTHSAVLIKKTALPIELKQVL